MIYHMSSLSVNSVFSLSTEDLDELGICLMMKTLRDCEIHVHVENGNTFDSESSCLVTQF